MIQGTFSNIMSPVKLSFSPLWRTAISLFVIASVSSGGYALTSDGNQALNAEEQRANDVRHSYEIKVIDRLLEQFHYKDYHLDDELSQTILDNYIDSLDPARLFFTVSDIQEIEKLKNNFDDYIRRGVTAAYHSIFNIYRKRVEQRINYALQRIEHNFNFSVDEYYDLDRSASSWAEDESELNTLWRKRIKNDLINLYLSDEDKDEALDILRKRYKSIAKRSNQIKDNEIFQIYINAYAGAIEPHTGYFSPRATEEFNISMSLSLQGIGAVLRSEDDQTEIVSIVPGGPADQSGQLHAEDKILAVAQGVEGEFVDIFGWRLSDVVDLIRGPKGSNVRLSVLPGALGTNASAIEISMVRENIKLESQAAKSRTLDIETEAGRSRLGIIVLPSFYIDFEARSNGDTDYRSTTRDVTRLIEELNEQQVEGIIIDLRGNGGGSLEEVVTLTGLFIDEGPVVQVKNSDGRVRTHSDRNSGALYDGPLAVMVDRQSASASEIFAGAIQDYKRGLIIGEPTFGKGTVQNVLPLSAYARNKFKDELGQIKITIAQFFRINGDSTQHRGVIPDIRWPFGEIYGEPFGERAFDNALPWHHITESKFVTSIPSIESNALEELRMLHEQRIEQDAAFIAELDKYKLLVETRIEKTVSLDRKLREEKREIFSQKLLDAENKIRLADGDKAYESYKQMRVEQEKYRDDNAYRSDVPIETDPFMIEAANILNDLLHIKPVQLVESSAVNGATSLIGEPN
jgi:carboxyl-terminal processing protease